MSSECASSILYTVVPYRTLTARLGMSFYYYYCFIVSIDSKGRSMTVNERASVPRLYECLTRFRGLWNFMSFWGGNKITFVLGGFLALHRLID